MGRHVEFSSYGARPACVLPAPVLTQGVGAALGTPTLNQEPAWVESSRCLRREAVRAQESRPPKG